MTFFDLVKLHHYLGVCFTIVIFLCWESKVVKSKNMFRNKWVEISIVDFEFWIASTTRPVYTIHLDFGQPFNSWRENLFPIKCFEIKDLSKLTRLRDTSLCICEASVTEKFKCVIRIIEESTHNKDGTNCCPSSSLARVTMHNNHIFWVFFKPSIDKICYLD